MPALRISHQPDGGKASYRPTCEKNNVFLFTYLKCTLPLDSATIFLNTKTSNNMLDLYKGNYNIEKNV